MSDGVEGKGVGEMAEGRYGGSLSRSRPSKGEGTAILGLFSACHLKRLLINADQYELRQHGGGKGDLKFLVTHYVSVS